jgi:uncharacterized protein with FMN-binding domain
MNTSYDSTTDERAARIAQLQAHRAAAGGSPRRNHPARGARAVALLTSIAATGGLGGALYQAEHQPTASAAPAGTAASSTAASSTATATTGTVAATAASSGAAAAVAAGTGTAAASTASSSTASSSTASASAAGTYTDGTYLGAAQYTRWGDVQVKVTIRGGAITDIVTVQVPSDGKSTSINNRATPVLEAQAIATQSSDLDIVSGATYTSRTYATSLQSALDQAAGTKAAPA